MGCGCPSLPPTRHPRLCTQCILNCQHVTEPMEQGREKRAPGGPNSLMSHPQCLRDSQGLRQAQGRRGASARKGLNEACRETCTPWPRGVTDPARCIVKHANFIYLPVCVPPRGWVSRLKSSLHLWAGLILPLVVRVITSSFCRKNL